MIDAIERAEGDVRLIVRAVPTNTRALFREVHLQSTQWSDVATLAASLEGAPGIGPWRDDMWIHPAEFVVQTRGFGASRTLYTTMAEGGPAQEMAALMVSKASEALPDCSAQDSPWLLRDCVQGR